MKRRPYIGLILILLPWMLLAVDLFGATITSNGTGGGSFRKGATWVGGTPPADGDLVVIAAGDSVWFNADVDTNFTIGNDGTGDLDISGKLTCINSGEIDTLFMKGGISVNNGGSLIIDKSSDGTDHFIIIIDCSSDGEHGIIVDNGGIINWDGASKLYATYSTSSTAASQADIVVNGDITDWNANDEIVVEGDVAGETEKLTIQSIASQTVTCTGNFTAQHDSARKVVNLTRNVKFTSANASYKTFIYNYTSIKTNFSLNYVEVSNLYASSGQGGVYFQTGGAGKLDYCSLHGGTTAHTIKLSKANSTEFSHNIVYNISNGIEFSDATNSVIENNYFIKLNRGFYTFLGGAYAVVFNNNYIIECTGGGITSRFTYLFKQANNNIFRINSGGDIDLTTSVFIANFEDCEFYSAVFLTGQSDIVEGSYINFSRFNNNNDDYRSYKKYGTIRSTGAGLDDIFVRTPGSLALKMTPNDASNALEWEFTVPCVVGEPMALTGYLYCTDRPANASSDIEPSVSFSGCGMTEDTHSFTIETDQLEDTWVQWTVSGTPTRNGLATVTVSCYDFSATNPDYYIDDIVVASTAIELGRLDYWYRGLPAPILLSTGIGAMDIWKSLISIDYGNGSMGEGVKNVIRRTPK